MVGSHDDGLGVEKDGDSDDVSHAFVEFSETEIPVVVDIHGAPDFKSLGSICFTSFVGKLFFEFLPDFVVLHF